MSTGPGAKCEWCGMVELAMIGQTYPGHAPVPPGWLVLYSEMNEELGVSANRTDFCCYSCLRQHATKLDTRLQGVVLPAEPSP